MLNRGKDYSENYEERLRGQARDKYRNLTEEEKKKEITDTTICLKKKNLMEYQKNYHEAKKYQYNNE